MFSPLFRRISKATYLTMLILLFMSAAQVCALDLRLPDRLHLPAKHYGHFERTAFIAGTRIGERMLIAGERGVIAFSDDAGQHWQQSRVPVSTLLTSMSVVNNQLVWAVGHSGSILFSEDKGESWTLQFDGIRANALLVETAQKNVQRLESELSEADEDSVEDLQFNLDDAKFALSNAEFDRDLGPANPFLDVVFISDREGFAVGAYGLFFKTEDAGRSWFSVAQRLENFDRYHLNTIAQASEETLIIAGEAGTLFASYDRGETWETLYGPYQGSFFGMQPTGVDDELYLYGLKGNLFKTEDGGQRWQRIELGVETSLTNSAISAEGRLAIVGLSGVIFVNPAKGMPFERIETEGFEGFNGVAFVDENTLVLLSDEGLQLKQIP